MMSVRIMRIQCQFDRIIVQFQIVFLATNLIEFFNFRLFFVVNITFLSNSVRNFKERVSIQLYIKEYKVFYEKHTF